MYAAEVGSGGFFGISEESEAATGCGGGQFTGTRRFSSSNQLSTTLI